MAERRGETFVMSGEGAQAPISFSTFILGLASTALFHLGETPPNFELAKQSLDLLELLELKTKGNLTQEEIQLFQSLITDLRLKFVAARGK